MRFFQIRITLISRLIITRCDQNYRKKYNYLHAVYHTYLIAVINESSKATTYSSDGLSPSLTSSCLGSGSFGANSFSVSRPVDRGQAIDLRGSLLGFVKRLSHSMFFLIAFLSLFRDLAPSFSGVWCYSSAPSYVTFSSLTSFDLYRTLRCLLLGSVKCKPRQLCRDGLLTFARSFLRRHIRPLTWPSLSMTSSFVKRRSLSRLPDS